MKKALILVVLVSCASLVCGGTYKSASEGAYPVEKLPAGYVRGDVVSYSYVPNRYWGRAESFGIVPYLFEYGLMEHHDDIPLEQFHEENVRRIDMAAQWSTVTMLYARRAVYRDEIIHLMIRCFRHRQLIVIRDYFRPGDERPLRNLLDILDKLWENRDRELTNPEGDRATGLQLINNILAVKLGDEGLKGLGTEGLQEMYRIFDETVKNKVIDGKRPFHHIKNWYNLVGYGIGAYAANAEDVGKGRVKLPSNGDFIGVDVYHWYFFPFSPFDPDDPNVSHEQIVHHAIHWQNIITKYHGPDFRVELGDAWDVRFKNDTHAMLQGLELGKADRTMMIFIGVSNYTKDSYTTPIETMDAYYDSIKAGPWVGLCWWYFTGETGTLGYLDKTLKHYTPDHPEGLPYSKEKLEDYRHRLIESRMRMFNDVVYGQFGYLNGSGGKR